MDEEQNKEEEVKGILKDTEEVPEEKEMTKEEEYLQGWKRARAELENVKKRIAQDYESQRLRMKQELLEPLLEVADNFQAIVQHKPKDLEDNSWAQGVVHVARQLENLLQVYGVSRIDAVGEEFDHNVHEAVEKESVEGKKEGIVLKVLRPGYKMGDVVIRPAQVTVSA